MTNYKSREWQRLYQKALFERDPEALPADIARAEAAIRSRLKHLSMRTGDDDERHAMSAALSNLSVLKNQHFPGWNVNQR
jgi:predicted nucleic acid-binding protein